LQEQRPFPEAREDNMSKQTGSKVRLMLLCSPPVLPLEQPRTEG